MRTVLRVQAATYAAILALAVTLASCSTVSGIVGQDATDKIKIGAEASLLLIRDGWIPALKGYHSLGMCGTPARPPCMDGEVYAKLYWATDAVTLCMQSATRAEVTLADFEGCQRRFDAARASFANSGVKITEATQ